MYNIYYSDPNKSTLSIDDNQIDNSTSLQIYGSGVDSNSWENILHLTENFCHIKYPSNPIEGQFFYDSANKRLMVYKIMGKITQWEIVGVMDGVDASNYINKNNINTVYNLKVTLDSSDPNNAITKQYADTWHSGISNGSNDNCQWTLYPNKYIIINGFGVGAITLPFIMQDTNYSVVVTNNNSNIHYLVENKTNKSFNTDSNMWLVIGYIK